MSVKSVDFRELEKIVADVFLRAGAPPTHAHLVASHLVDSNLVGHDSHGVMRVPQYVDAIRTGHLIPDAEVKVLNDIGNSSALDGQRSFGQVAARTAMDLAIEKARHSGIGAVTVFNCYHSGRIGAHSVLAAHQNMVGIVMVNAGGGGQSVAPFGGSRPRLATNPISIAAPPAEPFPLLLDIATSVAPEGKVRDSLQKGEKLPEGCVVDAKGNPTTDPGDFYQAPGGALLPLGGSVGYKGFGLGLMVDILAGALSGAGCCTAEDVPAKDGLLLMAIDVEKFGPVMDFHRNVLSLVEHVKSCPPAPGFDEVYVPGEREHRTATQRKKTGIPLPVDIWEEIIAIADAYEAGRQAGVECDGERTPGLELRTSGNGRQPWPGT